MTKEEDFLFHWIFAFFLFLCRHIKNTEDFIIKNWFYLLPSRCAATHLSFTLKRLFVVMKCCKKNFNAVVCADLISRNIITSVYYTFLHFCEMEFSIHMWKIQTELNWIHTKKRWGKKFKRLPMITCIRKKNFFISFSSSFTNWFVELPQTSLVRLCLWKKWVVLLLLLFLHEFFFHFFLISLRDLRAFPVSPPPHIHINARYYFSVSFHTSFRSFESFKVISWWVMNQTNTNKVEFLWRFKLCMTCGEWKFKWADWSFESYVWMVEIFEGVTFEHLELNWLLLLTF